MKRWITRGHKLGGIAVALALVAAACGGGSEATKDDLVAELVGDNLFTQEQAECFVDAVWDEIGPLDSGRITSPDDLTAAEQSALTAATFSCIDIGGLLDDSLTGETNFSPTDRAPGTNAEFDALWESCGGGDAEACDTLYFDSPVGSDYEEFGLSCGGRGFGNCVSVIADS